MFENGTAREVLITNIFSLSVFLSYCFELKDDIMFNFRSNTYVNTELLTLDIK